MPGQGVSRDRGREERGGWKPRADAGCRSFRGQGRRFLWTACRIHHGSCGGRWQVCRKHRNRGPTEAIHPERATRAESPRHSPGHAHRRQPGYGPGDCAEPRNRRLQSRDSAGAKSRDRQDSPERRPHRCHGGRRHQRRARAGHLGLGGDVARAFGDQHVRPEIPDARVRHTARVSPRKLSSIPRSAHPPRPE